MTRRKAEPFRIIAKTLSGLEGVLADELRALGAADVVEMNRAVECTGDRRLLYQAHLWCRCASRILMPIAEFTIAGSDEFYGQVSEIDWAARLSPRSTLAVDAIATHATGFDNSLYVARLTKDAICDQFRDRTGHRPSVDLAHPDIRVNVHIRGNEVTVSLDASGDPLTRRGYRTDKGQAPINEVLAAGIIGLTGWGGDTPFVDAMCGSGTFVIEAAMRARRIAPGLLRERFGFENWPDSDARLFAQLRKEARRAISPETPCPIVGSDIDGKRIAQARANADRAGVTAGIRLERRPLDKQIPPPGPGTFVINPPYGERMSVQDISALYRSIGDTLKRSYGGYRAYILTSNLAAAKAIGLRTKSRTTLYNGPLECRLLEYEMYEGTRKQKTKGRAEGEAGRVSERMQEPGP